MTEFELQLERRFSFLILVLPMNNEPRATLTRMLYLLQTQDQSGS